MKNKNLVLIGLNVLVPLITLGCNASISEAVDGHQTDSSSSVVAQIDASLRESYDVNPNLNGYERGYSLLKEICNDVGGRFDIPAQECFCQVGGLFTTGTETPSCSPLVDGGDSIMLAQISGVYSQPHSPDARIALSGDFVVDINLIPQFGSLVKSWSQAHAAQKPFRLSFFGYGEYNIQSSEAYVSDGVEAADRKWPGDQAGYRVMEGAPFDRYNVNYPLYEPNLKFTFAALDQSDVLLSTADQQQFTSLALPQDFYKKYDPSLAGAVLKAYQTLSSQGSFKPETLRSPFDTGCASYCVASQSMDIEDPRYAVSFKKVYQLGTPSARDIVIQDALSGDVLIVISLNVAQTVSTLTTVEPLKTADGGVSSLVLNTYDRYGKLVYTGSVDPIKSPFGHLTRK